MRLLILGLVFSFSVFFSTYDKRYSQTIKKKILENQILILTSDSLEGNRNRASSGSKRQLIILQIILKNKYNGSGTATTLEIARAFMLAKNEGNGPRRSVLIMPVSGEEKGLLGSKYYTKKPVFPLENTVTNLNIDILVE